MPALEAFRGDRPPPPEAFCGDLPSSPEVIVVIVIASAPEAIAVHPALGNAVGACSRRTTIAIATLPTGLRSVRPDTVGRDPRRRWSGRGLARPPVRLV